MLLPAQKRQLDFISPDINNLNEIILTVKMPSISGNTYRTLVRGHADSSSLEALTLFPEKSFYFPGRNEMMVYNHFGCYSYTGENGQWQEMDFIPSFSSGQPLSPLSLKALEMSPDGRYAAYIREDDGDTASLILYDRDMKVSLTVTSRLKREYLQDIVKWAPDSKYFIYRRGRELYYFSIEQYLSGRIPAESFRNTGFKDMQSIQWKDGNYLFILKDRHMYRLHSSEFFTRSFYSEPFRRGTVRGRLPVEYNPVFDSFEMDSSGNNLLLIKNGQNGIVIPLATDSLNSEVRQTPVLNMGLNDEILQAEWLENDILIIIVYNRKNKLSTLLRYQNKKDPSFVTLQTGSFSGFSVAPEGSRFALFTSDSVDIFNSNDDSASKSFSHSNSMQLFWGRDLYYSLGKNTIRTLDPQNGSSTIVGLSQSDEAGFNAGGDLISVVASQKFRYNEALNWNPLKEDVELRAAKNTTKEYRIYLENLNSSWYSTSLKVRDVESFYTSDFIPQFHSQLELNAPQQLRTDSVSNPWYFDHGQSSNRKEISLVINAVDSAVGTAQLMDILENYAIPTTFFINGDFIHANPMETNTIAESGHTVGSLFYTWFDMSAPGYQIDKTFLKKGLARNEDDYFISTGKEMAMLWHTPSYYINSDILETSASMQYVFIGTDIAVQDRISRTNASNYDAVEEAEKLLKRVKPGSIISLTLGEEEGQKEYLFKTLPMILDELLRNGYDFVDLQDMMKTSR